MPVAKLSASQELLLGKHLSIELVDHELVRSAYACLCLKETELHALHALILASSLQVTLGHQPNLIALVLLHKLTEDNGHAFIDELDDERLKSLQGHLVSLIPAAVESMKFKKLAERWQIEANGLVPASDQIKALKLACLADGIHRKSWDSILHKQLRIERASVFVEALQGCSGVATQHLSHLRKAINDSAKQHEPPTSALARVSAEK
jgi:hypothetical protein